MRTNINTIYYFSTKKETMSQQKKNARPGFSEIWERISQETPIKSYVQLAEIVGSSKQTVSRKKGEDTFPVEWAFEVSQAYNLFTNWIMTGKGPKNLDECHEAQEVLLTGYIAEWLREQSRKDANFSANFQTDCALSFPEFAQWLKERKVTKQ